MGFSTLFIRRPIATSLLMVAVLLLGILGYRQLPVSALPEIEAPSLVVSTQYPGASANTMASLITTPRKPSSPRSIPPITVGENAAGRFASISR